MGADIHLYLEHSAKEPSQSGKRHWCGVGGRINPGRDYDLFAKIAGVRDYSEEGSKKLFEPRGVPDDLGWEAAGDNRLKVIPDGEECSYETGYREVNRSRAESWVQYGSYWMPLGENPEYWASDPDNHSHTWLTPAEFRQVLEAPRPSDWGIDAEYWALLAAAEELERRDREVRFVIWFDS